MMALDSPPDTAVAQRFDAGLRSTAVPVPGGFNSVPPNDLQSCVLTGHLTSAAWRLHNQHSNGHAFTTLYSNKPSATQSLPSGSRPLSRQGGYANIEDAEGKKRSWNDELDEEHESKKTRVEGDELIDGDEDAEFDDAVPKRGSKRGIRDDEASEMKKRARKVSQEADHSMDVDEEEEDEITELKSVYRGKKRDRAEAGSTFGGDDDDSAVEHEAEDDSKARRRRRKRRTVVKRKSEATYLRDKRAQHNGDEELSEESDDTSPSKVSTQRRKSKRSSLGRHQRERSKSDVSMDESITSTRTKVREIGDEWESNGVKYKIGLNGQRLRQALVKKARQKFVMVGFLLRMCTRVDTEYCLPPFSRRILSIRTETPIFRFASRVGSRRKNTSWRRRIICWPGRIPQDGKTKWRSFLWTHQ